MYGALVAGRPDSEEQHLEAVHFCWRPSSAPGLMPAGDTEQAPFSTVKQRGQVNSIKDPRNCGYLNLQLKKKKKLQLNKSIKRQKIMSNFYLHFSPNWLIPCQFIVDIYRVSF